MSIQSQINRINSNVSSAYDVALDIGATMPGSRNIANLASTIRSIPIRITSGPFNGVPQHAATTINGQLDRIRHNVSIAYDAAASMGAVIPGVRNSTNLSSTIRSIPSRITQVMDSSGRVVLDNTNNRIRGFV